MDLALPNLVQEPLVMPAQVLVAQVNILREGILLSLAVAHNVVDERGFFNILRAWSTYCRVDNGLGLVEQHWTDRKPLMQRQESALSEDVLANIWSAPVKTASSSDVPGESPELSPPGSQPSNRTAIFFFPAASLARLKSAASKASADLMEKDSQNKDWISTSDAPCALLWCSITSARASGTLDQCDKVSCFNMAVDCRSRVSPPISHDYIGKVILVTKAQATFEYLLSAYPSRIADVASLLRSSLLAVNDVYIKNLMETIRSARDVSDVTPPVYPSFQRNVGCTS